MIINPARTTRHHLANQAAPVYLLIRKRSTCGKVSTARQLRQYGGCICKAAASKKQPFGEGEGVNRRNYSPAQWGGGQARRPGGKNIQGHHPSREGKS